MCPSNFVAQSSVTQGIVYVAFGDGARAEAEMSMRALRSHNPTLKVATISETPIGSAKHISFDDPRYGARWAKLNLDTLSPFDDTLYLDADTRPRANLEMLFASLRDGFDMAIAPSTQQGDKSLWHVDKDEREATFDAFGFTPLQFQAGVFAFRKSEAMSALFQAWRDEWRDGQDQAALLRALQKSPVKLWLMSATLSEVLVLHLFGKVRR